MTTREAALIGLRDTLEHLSECEKQMAWTEEPTAIAVLAETMSRDLERCQRLLNSLRRLPVVRSA